MAISNQPSAPHSDAVLAQAEPLFAQGLRFHSEGELAKAMHTYEQVLKLAPRHVEALHHVGIVAFQTGNFDMAAGFIRSALTVDPDHAGAHGDLGNALREMQHLEDALRSYDRALELTGGDADTYYNRAVALQALQRQEDALHSYDQALELNAGDDQAWNNRAVVFQQTKRYAAALQSVEQALALNPHNVEAYNNRGNILRELGRLDEAGESYRRALELVPQYADAHCNLGRLLLSRERFEDALQCYDQAIGLDPQLAQAYRHRAIVLRKLNRTEDALRDNETASGLQRELTDAYCKLGKELREQGRPESAAGVIAALLKLDGSDSDAGIWQLHARMLNAAGRHEDALASIGRALALKPDSGDYHLTRGAILRATLQYEAARQCYEKAVELAPRHPGGYTNLGSVLDQMGHAGLALKNYDHAIALDPDCAPAHWNRGLVYLRQGDYERGWREYEWRWKAETLAVYKGKRDFPQPAWTGREPLEGKTILLHAEQGLGDTLQFCRYAPLVAQRGAIVILEAQQPLAGLLGTLAGGARVVVKGEPLPQFDYHIPLMSLPLAFDTRLDTVPGAAPYLACDQAKLARWDALLGAKTRLRVGVVWSGHPSNPNDQNRSVPLQAFARLFSDQCEFVSLQKEVKPAEQALLDALPVRQLTDQLHDFTDTAALCELMDVVVTVDTSVAHLAGALGKPVWVLLQTPFEWRWLEQGSGSPWYPGATLYRQSQRGDWAPVIDAVAADLGKLAESQAPRG
uniref:TPR repeat protein n=1 Tax=uncultured bacterium BLR13 TaxID=506515 RepID=C0INK2_9BACT|nr:TPR repeat protein [uncultured bacterium BLR13]